MVGHGGAWWGVVGKGGEREVCCIPLAELKFAVLAKKL